MKLVLDTNVLIAAFISRGHCHELLEHVVRTHDLYTSEFILGELRDKLTTKFRMPEDAATDTLTLLRGQMQVVAPVTLSVQISRDPDDDNVLGTAVAADADVLITGDSDLLVLERHQGFQILAPGQFWEFEAKH